MRGFLDSALRASLGMTAIGASTVDSKTVLNRLIFANLAHRPVRTLLSVLAIAVEVTMILTLVGVSHGTLDSTARRARGVGADIVIRPPNSSVMSSLNSAPISDKYVDWLSHQPHVVAATGTAVMSLAFPDSITGVDFPSFDKMSGGYVYKSGGNPVGDDDIAVDEYYAQQKHVDVGDRLKLGNHLWRVSGIYDEGMLAHTTVKLSALQNMMGWQGHVTVLWAKLDDPTRAPQEAEFLKQQLVNFPVYTMDEFASMFSVSNVGMLKDFIGVVIGVSVVVGFIVVFMAMYTAVLERTREIGIIKAVGGGPLLVLQILARETLLLAVLGTVAGIMLTFGTQWIMRHAVPGSLVQETVYGWWPIAGAIAIGGALLGVIVPAYKAMNQDVTEALSYE